MSENKSYDYIIAGTGCAGLSLAIQLKRSSVAFSRVLLVDRDLKNKNDRTWSFWTRKKGNWFDAIIFKKWNRLSFKNHEFEKVHGLSPYSYNMIRGLDFYNYCLAELRADNRFEFITAEIGSLYTVADKGFVKINDRIFSASYIFNSAVRNFKPASNNISYVQHFMGWEIETKEPCFDETVPVLMDFRVKQYNDCRFCYVLPFSTTKALVEYTGFSQNAISKHEYEKELSDYILNHLKIKSFQINEIEEGSIPMTNGRFTNLYGNRIINIGTAGGNTKGSSGYTFYFIQQYAGKLVSRLEKGEILENDKKRLRFEWYDRIFLQVLAQKKIAPEKIFSALFEAENIQSVLAFLNEESTVLQDLQVFKKVPAKQFTRAAVENFFAAG